MRNFLERLTQVLLAAGLLLALALGIATRSWLVGLFFALAAWVVAGLTGGMLLWILTGSDPGRRFGTPPDEG